MDSANILSILAGLGSQGQAPPPGADAPDVQLPGVAQNNVMQAAAPAAPAPAPTPAPADVAAAATAASPAMPQPHPRRSLLDTIGRISDVLAQVGGATPLYQPTLDARQAHEQAQEDRQRQIEKEGVDLATSKFDLSNKQTEASNDERTRFASVLDAVNDSDDAANLPSMMQAAGLTDPKYAPFVKMVQDNPEQAKVLSGALGGGDGSESGKQIKYGYDATGKRIAFTVNSDGSVNILNGVTPDENIKVVNTGDKTSLVGPNGRPITIIPNKASPNTVLTTQTSRENAVGHDKTQLTIAGMPARAQPGKGSGGAAEDANIPMYLNNIRQGFTDLHNMQALPGEGGALGQVEGAIGRTAVGQKVGEQMGTPAAQKRLEVTKNISQLQQAMLKSLPASATRTKFEQEMLARGLPDPAKMNYKTANTVIDQLYSSYQNALKNSKPKAAAPAPSARPAGWENAPTLGPADALKLPSGAKFVTLDGRPMTRH